MAEAHNPKLRFGMSLQEATEHGFDPKIGNLAPLPAIDYGAVGKAAPMPQPTPADKLPSAYAVVITWANAEWAALQHVFCAGAMPMPYSNRTHGSWPGWEKYAVDLPAQRPSGWDYWGYTRLVNVGGKTVLLFKSNTHLDYPGAADLQAIIKRLIAEAKPAVILSVGTSGGTKLNDHIGTVRAVSAGTLYEAKEPPKSWPVYKNAWQGSNATLAIAGFGKLLFPVPSKASDLADLCAQFNSFYSTKYTLAELDPHGLNSGNTTPRIQNQTGGAASLLTTSSFVVGTTSGNYQAYTSIEMDDAIIGEACSDSHTPFGFVRNISDPVQNANLPAKMQGNWGSAVYDVYGLYTSYNGALAAWAMLA